MEYAKIYLQENKQGLNIQYFLKMTAATKIGHITNDQKYFLHKLL